MSTAPRTREDLARDLNRAGFLASSALSFVRHLGALHVMVLMGSASASAGLMLGVGAPGQVIAWRPWSIDVVKSTTRVVDEALAFVAALDAAWPQGDLG